MCQALGERLLTRVMLTAAPCGSCLRSEEKDVGPEVKHLLRPLRTGRPGSEQLRELGLGALRGVWGRGGGAAALCVARLAGTRSGWCWLRLSEAQLSFPPADGLHVRQRDLFRRHGLQERQLLPHVPGRPGGLDPLGRGCPWEHVSVPGAVALVGEGGWAPGRESPGLGVTLDFPSTITGPMGARWGGGRNL